MYFLLYVYCYPSAYFFRKLILNFTDRCFIVFFLESLVLLTIVYNYVFKTLRRMAARFSFDHKILNSYNNNNVCFCIKISNFIKLFMRNHALSVRLVSQITPFPFFYFLTNENLYHKTQNQPLTNPDISHKSSMSPYRPIFLKKYHPQLSYLSYIILFVQ